MTVMNYDECLNFLYQQLPVYQYIGEKAYKPGLHNILQLCQNLNNPHRNFPSIHVAGTNGKGSVSHQLAAILQSAGYNVGLYTSPHLVDFRERIKINGQLISETFITDYINNHISIFDKLNPSFFELTTAMAFLYFSLQNVDIAVIETGLGGRLDSTNILYPLLSIITNISYDHMHILGNTLKKIAMEKAGIIKKGIPVIIGETTQETKPIFLNKAMENHAPIYFGNELYRCNLLNYDPDYSKYVISDNSDRILMEGICDLKGYYQRKNIITTYTAIQVLNTVGYHISNSTFLDGMSSVKMRTGLLGRWQKISSMPLVICDTAHNTAGILEVVDQLAHLNAKNYHLILGFVKDKDVKSIISIFSEKLKNANIIYYLTQLSVPRSLQLFQLNDLLIQFNIQGNTFSHVKLAYQQAKKNANKEDIIFIGGSNFLVGDFLSFIHPTNNLIHNI